MYKRLLIVLSVFIFGCNNGGLSGYQDAFEYSSDKFNECVHYEKMKLISGESDSAMYYKGKSDAHYESEVYFITKMRTLNK